MFFLLYFQHNPKQSLTVSACFVFTSNILSFIAYFLFLSFILYPLIFPFLSLLLTQFFKASNFFSSTSNTILFCFYFFGFFYLKISNLKDLIWDKYHMIIRIWIFNICFMFEKYISYRNDKKYIKMVQKKESLPLPAFISLLFDFITPFRFKNIT